MDLRQGFGRRPKVYSEAHLDRKMREERSRWPVVAEDSPSDEFCLHVRGRHLAALMRAAKLTPLERRVFILSANGATLRQIAGILGISKQRVSFQAAHTMRKLRQATRDRYHGLHEVYWQEVRRYVYRKPRHAYDAKRCADV